MTRKQRPVMVKAAATGPLLKQLLQQWGLEGKLREYAAWQVWDEVVGPQIAARARPARVRDGVLEVRVDQARRAPLRSCNSARHPPAWGRALTARVRVRTCAPRSAASMALSTTRRESSTQQSE